MSWQRRRRRATKVGYPPRAAFFGLLGVGNIGNEASLRAVAEMLRSPDRPVELSSICANPDQVFREHGIPGVHMRAEGNRPEDRDDDATVPARALAKLRSVVRLLRVIGDVDAVMMAGMGALEDHRAGNPWGMAFDLAALSVAARLRGRSVMYISVGATPAQSRLLALFSRVALYGTSYVTYRDDYSADVYPMPCRERLVYPDVAFTLPVVASGRTEDDLIVVGVMDYYGRSDDYTIGAADHERYLRAMTTLIADLVAHGWRVRVLVGDEKDRATVDELRHRLLQLAESVSFAEAAHYDEVMREVSRARVAVVSRYHNLVAALATCTPVVSLSYAVKCDVLMQNVGLDDFTQPIGAFDAGRLLQQVEQLSRESTSIREQLATQVARLSSEAAAQRTRLLDAVHSAARPPRRRGRHADTVTIGSHLHLF